MTKTTARRWAYTAAAAGMIGNGLLAATAVAVVAWLAIPSGSWPWSGRGPFSP